MHNALRVSLATTALVSVMFSGCTELFGSDASGSLARIVEMSMDPDTFADMEYVETPEDFMNVLGTAKYVYTHKSGEVATKDVSVRFTDDSGRERTAKLSEFTQKGTLNDGDSVTIDGVAMYSAIRLSADGDTLAARGTEAVDWFAVDGVPLPIAGDPGALASWTTTTTSTGDMGMDDAAVYWYEEYESICYNDETQQWDDCSEYDEGTMEVTDVTFDALQTIVQDMSLAVVSAGGAERLDLSSSVEMTGHAFFDMYLQGWSEYGELDEQGEPRSSDRYEEGDGHYGFSLEDATLQADGTASLFFDRSGRLQTIGMEGSVYADATLEFWDNATAPEGDPDDFDHPLIDESEPYQEEPYEDYGEEDEISELLAHLWAMDLRVGDEFHVDMDMMDLGQDFGTEGGFAMQYELIVVEREDKNVGGTTYDALRLQGHGSFVYVVGDETTELDFSEFTFWIGAESYVPIYLEVTYNQVVGLADLEPILDAIEAEMGDEVDLTRPTIFDATGTMTTVLAINDLRGDIRVAAPLTIGGLFNSPFALMGPALAGMLDDQYEEEWDGEWDDEEYTYIGGGDVQFNRDSAALEITVTSSDYSTYWEDLDISGCDSWPQGIIIVGEVIEGCVGPVEIIYTPTNMLIFQSYA